MNGDYRPFYMLSNLADILLEIQKAQIESNAVHLIFHSAYLCTQSCMAAILGVDAGSIKESFFEVVYEVQRASVSLKGPLLRQ